MPASVRDFFPARFGQRRGVGSLVKRGTAPLWGAGGAFLIEKKRSEERGEVSIHANGRRRRVAPPKELLMKRTPLFLLLSIPAAFGLPLGCGGSSSSFPDQAGRDAGAGKGGSSGRGGTGSGGTNAGTGGSTARGGSGSGVGGSAGRDGRGGSSSGRGGAAGEAGMASDGGTPGVAGMAGMAGMRPMPPHGEAGMPGNGGAPAEEECPDAAPMPMSACSETRPPLRCSYPMLDCRCMGERWTCEAAQPECPAMEPVQGSPCERRTGPGGRCRYEEVECDCAMDTWECRERPEPPGPPGAAGAPDGPPGGAGAPG